MTKKANGNVGLVARLSASVGFVAALLVGGAIATVEPAAAQTICGERADFLTQLQKRHGETPSSIGLSSSGQVLEVLTSKEGTWTILMTSPQGRTCLVAAGEAWENLPKVALGPAA